VKRRKREGEAEVEANLIPVMSCMFLLIPALLLAMEVAPYAAVRVETPRFSDLTEGDPEHSPERLRFRVHVREDGFTARYGSSPESERTIDIPLQGAGDHDFDALELRARELKVLFPEDMRVTVSAEASIEYQTLVQSMDALRGSECSLGATLLGEREPEGCYFWSVIVQSGTV